MEKRPASRAIVRGVPDSYVRCLRPSSLTEEIDLDLARLQHRAYCRALEDAGLEVIEVPADERFPDCCFVEDTSVVLGDMAIMTVMGAPSRAGEGKALREVLAEYLDVRDMSPPGTVDGGDVLVVGRDVFIGVGERTDDAGVDGLVHLAGSGFRIKPVPIKGVLHLKSACTCVGDGHLLFRPGHFDAGVFRDYRLIEVPEEESYAANCLSLGSAVLVSEGYPAARGAIESAGFETVALEMSEFRKGQGSLTCLSKIL